jgi:hypothetical protein
MPDQDRGRAKKSRRRSFTFGRKPSRSVSWAAARIILLAFVIGFGLDTFNAIAALVRASSAQGGTSDGDQTAMAGYTLALYLGGAAAVLGMRTALLAPLNLTAADLGLKRPSGLPRWRPAAAVLIYVVVLTAASSLTSAVLGWLHVSLAAACLEVSIQGPARCGSSCITPESPDCTRNPSSWHWCSHSLRGRAGRGG